ncbi:hypothetical protein DFP72DRAFT_154563 [Ephemerocybe angulata]|uniref:F-box domain-containing protein n=1 Tax=Ephemerocybe angulata TaxID=980116 RepID=A0A8H6LU90_9AGAR|nr:hypothetical protein DFP72DRAFT_154563 [Tulosesus angulatus]
MSSSPSSEAHQVYHESTSVPREAIDLLSPPQYDHTLHIPDEVLLKFLLPLVFEPFATWDICVSVKHPAFVASQVSSNWRRIALGAPILWSNIQVGCPRLYDHFRVSEDSLRKWNVGTKIRKELVTLWLSRSAQCPLDVHFNDRGGGLPMGVNPVAKDVIQFFGKYYVDLYNLILPCSSRLKVLQFDLELYPFNLPILRLLHIPPQKLPSLQRIDVKLKVPHGMDTAAIDFDIPGQRRLLKGGAFRTPSLHSLSISGSGWGDLRSLDVLSSWPGIEAIDFSNGAAPTSLDQLILLLKSLPELRRCRYRLINPQDHPLTPPSDAIHHSRLESLSLHDDPPPLGFATLLNFPSLKSLEMAYVALKTDPDSQVHDDRGSRVVEMILQFGSQLTSLNLVLRHDIFDQPSFHPKIFLGHLPELLHFTLIPLWKSKPDSGPNLGFLFEIPAMPSLTLELPTGPSIVHEPGVTPEGRDSSTLEALVLEHGASAESEQDNSESNAGRWCPKLRSLYTLLRNRTGAAEHALVDFIVSRRRNKLSQNPFNSEVALPQITEVEVEYSSEPKVNILEELREKGVDMRGLTLKLKYPEYFQMYEDEVF